MKTQKQTNSVTGRAMEVAETLYEIAEVMDDLDGLLVIHTPGHCAGQVAFLWQREGGVLFVGDAAANTLGHEDRYLSEAPIREVPR